MLQDRLDRTVAGVADVVAAPAGGFESCRAVAPGQPQNTEAGAEALLGFDCDYSVVSVRKRPTGCAMLSAASRRSERSWPS